MRLYLLYRYIIVLLIISLITPYARAATKDQRTKVILRSIGHEFLLQINDSTSRIMPIERVGGRYKVRFEKSFSFEPDLLFFSTFKIFEERSIEDSYIIEVEKCETKELVHSFEANLKMADDLMVCRQRMLPKDCYIFYFTLIESESYIKVKNSSSLNYIYFISLIIIGGFIVLFYRKKKRKDKIVSDLIYIGEYQFDKKKMILIFQETLVNLSSKEVDLLSLLYSNENKTLEREYILKVVWGDEGNYVGRTLDVFISKIRKKLERDPTIKIVNVRGVGYRLVLN